MLKLSLPPEMSEVSSAFSLLWNSWRAKVWTLSILKHLHCSYCCKFKRSALAESIGPLLSSHVRLLIDDTLHI